ncbi:mediator of RNA polymerase II transcription subunit 15a-like isoform X1 [Senna tora]|uniref:Mediator of RNA polymerase II transcription subunit 15a-like isoform X1 n=1 Tax=Senna tora TaxID=362788 RepID=A0A834TCA3_9FABA|nr:mediator of RNA polymerase II transcription subunit 15a-like isoform X1 [Senna tora]
MAGQQNNISSLAQHQQQQQPQLMNQQNNLSNIHQQQLGSNVSGLQQQQQLLAAQSGNSGMQTSQHSAHMLQQSKVPMQQQSQQNVSNLLPSQGQQSQPQAPQQQLMPQMQSQPAQLGLQQQPNQLQRDMQQRLQASGSLLQQQNVLDPQKQLYQSQRALPDSSSKQVPAHMQTHQMPQLHQINDMNDVKMRQGLGVKPGVYQQHLPGQRSAYPHQQLKSGGAFPVSSPHLLQAASPQIAQHSSPQVDQQSLPSHTKVSTPLQSANSPFVVPTPSPPLAPSPMPGDSEKPISVVSSVSNAANIGHQQAGVATAPAQSLAIGTPGISASPLLAEFSCPDGAHGTALAVSSAKSTVAEQPIERLVKAVKSISRKALSSAVSDIGSVVSMIDRIAGSAPGNGSRAAVGEDLVAMTKCRLQARNYINHDGTNGTKRMRRYASAMPLNVISSPGSMNDSIKQLTSSEVSDLESSATSSIKKPRIEANHALLEEIREINQRLIDTVVDISDEDVDPTAAAAAAEGSEGTIVKCSFSAVALSPCLKSQYSSAQMSPIQPLRLLVPTNYPNCSPILLDKFPVETSKENEDLSVKAKSRFSISLRSLSQPMTLGEIARTWDVCARAIISEYAQQSGGGTFSSKYGTWEDCLSAA